MMTTYTRGLQMKFKKRHWLLVFTLVLPLTCAGAHTGQRSAGQSPADSAARARIADDFSNAILVAKDHYAGQLDFNKVTKASITGMLRTLDPHSMYFDRQQWEDFQNDQSSRYYGIGSTIIQQSGTSLRRSHSRNQRRVNRGLDSGSSQKQAARPGRHYGNR